MNSVRNNENTIIIKNSKFICCLYSIRTMDDISLFLDEVQKKYPNATHYCYAYILDNVKKASDDGEPTGTAGIPILQVLEKNQLNHVLCIVVRYFGKIKLGANGLVRAYTKSVVECLKENIILLQKGFFITISFDYSILKKVDYLVQDALIVEKNYEEKIIYQLYSSEQLLEQLQMLPTLVVKMRRPCYF